MHYLKNLPPFQDAAEVCSVHTPSLEGRGLCKAVWESGKERHKMSFQTLYSWQLPVRKENKKLQQGV